LSYNAAADFDPVPVSVRQDHEAPSVIAVQGWRYHHIGIPTKMPRPGEQYLAGLKMYVSGFESSPYGIQWMRFDADSCFPEMVKSVPHVAFEVDNLEAALGGKEILIPPNCPSAGVKVAMIIDNGAPVELLEFQNDVKSASTSTGGTGLGFRG
jgi:hypothetical protein